jgi:flavin reductase (DIM6/NTAB) family NADH-FMN oxidoreductase RutF
MTTLQTTLPDEHTFRSVFASVPTSVAVVTGFGPNEEPVGLAVGSLVSVSLDPPLLSFCAAQTSQSWPQIRLGGWFCVNVLARDQEHVCRSFARSGQDKFLGLDWQRSAHGLPELAGAVATMDCLVTDEIAAGDHTIVLGQVVHMSARTGADPLVFRGGRYGTFVGD